MNVNTGWWLARHPTSHDWGFGGDGEMVEGGIGFYRCRRQSFGADDLNHSGHHHPLTKELPQPPPTAIDGGEQRKYSHQPDAIPPTQPNEEPSAGDSHPS